MRYLTWLFRLLLFMFLLGLAIKNTDTVTLRYYFGFEWQAPLVLILLVFFATGAGVGILACLGKLFRQRRQFSALEREVKERKPAYGEPEAGLPSGTEGL